MASLSFWSLALLLAVFFATCAIGVVTGSNSLITVPLMFQFGIEPRVAVATNMFGLTFMSMGAAVPFVGKNVFDRRRMPALLVLTLMGSAIGATLVGLISNQLMPIIVSISMFAVIVFSFLKRDVGVQKNLSPTKFNEVLTYALTFLLGIYGGLYSGGYTTILTSVYVGLLGMTFTEAVANTKLINIFSSLIATLIFAWQNLIDYRLGAILAVTMFAAAYTGAKFVTKMNDAWLRRIFLATVLGLATKILLIDILKI